MSIRHPRRRPRNGEVIDLEDINDNFTIFYEEVGAKLNAHNFGAGEFDRNPVSASEGFEDDIGMRLFYARDIEEDNLVEPISAAAGIQIAASGAWNVIREWSFESRGGTLWVHISGQGNFGEPGAQTAIAVNGAVAEDTVTGTIDHEVEVPMDPSRPLPLNQRGIYSPGGGSFNRRQPFNMNALVPVPPGTVTVALLAMSMVPWDDQPVYSGDGSDETKRVFTYEIYCFELT